MNVIIWIIIIIITLIGGALGWNLISKHLLKEEQIDNFIDIGKSIENDKNREILIKKAEEIIKKNREVLEDVKK
jgi:predicted negative regulator of RcsB-dependent stress response